MHTPAEATRAPSRGAQSRKGRVSSAASATAIGAFAADRCDDLSSLTPNCGGSWLAA